MTGIFRSASAFPAKRKHSWSSGVLLSYDFPEPPEKKSETPRTARSCSHNDDSAYFSCIGSLRGDDVSDLEASMNADSFDFFSQHKQEEISSDALRIHYKFLKQEIDPKEVEDHLHQWEAIDSGFLEQCRETPNRSRRVDLLLKKIYSTATLNDPNILGVFERSLHATDQCHVAEKLAECIPEPNIKDDIPKSQLTEFVKEMEGPIFENAEPKDFVDDMVTNGTLPFHDHEDIITIISRRDRVAFYMNMVRHALSLGDDHLLIRKMIQPMINVYPKLFEEYRRKSRQKCHDVPQVKVGSVVRVRCHIKGNTEPGLLRQIERNCVRNFYANVSSYEEWLDNIVEECRCSFEKLKISSVVIQLRTTQGDSLYRVYKACEEGQAVQWILALLDERDRTELTRVGPTKLLIKIVAEEKGNEDNLHHEQGCLCILNRKSILGNYRLFRKNIHDIDNLIECMCEQNMPGKEELETLKQFKAGKQFQSLLDFLLQKEIPQIYFCVLQKHIQKTGHTAFLQAVSQDYSEMTISLTKSDILEHEDYIKEEIDIRHFTPIIFSRETQSSNQLQREMQTCKSRRCRIDLILHYLREEEDISWFWDRLRDSQKYIWDAILSYKESRQFSGRDLLAVNIMNDCIVDEIDPLQLKTWMNELTIQKLGFSDFEEVSSRRTRAQFMINRLSPDTVGSVLMALRRSGHEHIANEIKAGSLSNKYECPRLMKRNYERKCVFHCQFEMNFSLKDYNLYERQYFNTDDISKVSSETRVTISKAIGNDKDATTKSHTHALMKTFKPLAVAQCYKRQNSVESTRDSESGVYSGSEGAMSNNEVLDVPYSEDEGIALGPSGSLSTNSDDNSSFNTHSDYDLAASKLKYSLTEMCEFRSSSKQAFVGRGKVLFPEEDITKGHMGTNVFFKPSRPEQPKGFSLNKSVRKSNRKYLRSHLTPSTHSKLRDINHTRGTGWKLDEPETMITRFAKIAENKSSIQTHQVSQNSGKSATETPPNAFALSKPTVNDTDHPNVVKSYSDIALFCNHFGDSCSLKATCDERAFSSPPHARNKQSKSCKNKQ